jgi:hypothetical protein
MDGRGLALSAVVAALLTAAIAGPVLRAPASQLFGHEIVGRHHDPFTVIEQYAAGAVPASYLQPATDLPGIALALIVDAVAAYNALVLWTFVLTAAFAYAHAFHLIGSRVGALVAALLFALSPFHVAHAAYHVHIAQIQWIPLFFLCLWWLVERPSLTRACAAGGALLLVAAASAYLGFVTAIVTPVAAVAYIAARTRVSEPRRAALHALAMLIGVAAIVVGAIAVRAPQVLWNPGAFAFPAWATEQHSARWWSYVLPAAAHPLFGERAAEFVRSQGIREGLLEQQLSVGIGALALACAALVLRRGRSAVGQAQPLWPLAAVATIAAVLSLPAAAAVFHPVAPMFRAYARFGVITSLMVSTLAGAGVAALIAQRRRAATAAAAALIALTVFEYLPAIPAAHDALPTSAHRALAGRPDVRLFDCTAPTPGSIAGVRALMQTAVIFPGGPIPDCAESHVGGKLAVFGITHLLVRPDGVPADWLAAHAPDGTRPFGAFSDATLFAVTASPPAVYVGELQGFFDREYRADDTWRWMGKQATITLVNVAAPTVIRLALEIEAFHAPRTITAALNDSPVGAFAASPVQERQVIGPLALDVGTNTLLLTADATVAPRELVNGTDPRPLSIRLRRWEVRPAARLSE